MMMYAQYLMDRYLGKKGQGLTEYAIILLMVVLIAVVIWQGNGLKSMITGILSEYWHAVYLILSQVLLN